MKVTITALKAPWPAGAELGHVVEFAVGAVPAWAAGKCKPAADDAEVFAVVEAPLPPAEPEQPVDPLKAAEERASAAEAMLAEAREQMAVLAAERDAALAAIEEASLAVGTAAPELLGSLAEAPATAPEDALQAAEAQAAEERQAATRPAAKKATRG